jgi:hypothetical protein
MQGNIATRAGFLLRNRACVQADIAVSLVRYLEIFVGAIVNLPVLSIDRREYVVVEQLTYISVQSQLLCTYCLAFSFFLWVYYLASIVLLHVLHSKLLD